MTKSKSLEYDLRYIQAALEALESYLLSGEVFWPIGINPPAGEPEYPRLTLDGLLLARARVSAHPKTSDQSDQVGKVLTELDLHRTRHRVAWEQKAEQCYQVRLRMWGDYLQEYRDNPGDNADRYAYEVRLRVMLCLLKPELRSLNLAEAQLLSGLDKYLKSVLVGGGFIWDPAIQSGFPGEEYWYLYGKLRPLSKI